MADARTASAILACRLRIVENPTTVLRATVQVHERMREES